jgi:ATP-dependent Clp protease adaptor protein ClpS
MRTRIQTIFVSSVPELVEGPRRDLCCERLGSVADTLEHTDEDTDLRVVVEPDRPWITLVWNDPVNEMTYVAWVFKSYFGFSPAEARKRMLQVHNEGKAVVATGPREEMERHVYAMHGYGLWATLQKDDE